MVVKIKDLNNGNYVSILNDIAQDMSLSVHSRSMLLYMLSMPPETQFTVSKLAIKNGFTDKRTKATIKELVERGYMKSIKIKDEKGKFIKFDYIVTQRQNQFSQLEEDFNAIKSDLPF